jgi:hypothetical protein
MASEVEPSFVPAAENKGWLHSAPERLFAYPQVLDAPVAMTFP